MLSIRWSRASAMSLGTALRDVQRTKLTGAERTARKRRRRGVRVEREVGRHVGEAEELQRRLATATRVPKGEYFNPTAADPIVEMITNPGEMQTPYAFRTSMQHARPNARLCAQKQECLRQILIEGFGRKIAISVPPLSGPVNLGLCAFRDADLHGLSRRDDEQASQAPLRRIPFLRARPRQWKEAIPPPVQA
jgi:hypothetical protein